MIWRVLGNAAFIGLEFGLRCTVFVSTGVAILLLSLTIDFVPWVHNSLRRAGAEIALNSELLVAAVAFEVVNASAMNYVYFKPSKVSVPQKKKPGLNIWNLIKRKKNH